jgi:hypothetical protein
MSDMMHAEMNSESAWHSSLHCQMTLMIYPSRIIQVRITDSRSLSQNNHLDLEVRDGFQMDLAVTFCYCHDHLGGGSVARDTASRKHLINAVYLTGYALVVTSNWSQCP